MEKAFGSCLCSEVKFEVDGPFESFFLCHCKYCQKDTGSAHAANLFSQTARLTWLQGKEHVKTFTLPETRHTKAFCKHCGSALPNIQEEGPLLVVPAGCLDSNLEKRPDAHLFVSSRSSWDFELERIHTFEKLPTNN